MSNIEDGANKIFNDISKPEHAATINQRNYKNCMSALPHVDVRVQLLSEM